MTPAARFVLAAAGAALSVASCAHPGAPSVPVETRPPCVSVAVEPEPPAPALTDAQRLAADRALVAGLGAPLAAAYVLFYEVTHPEWGRRSAAGLDALRASCDATNAPS